MEMALGITIEKLEVRVKLAQGRTDNIKAFGELWFYGQGESEPTFKVRGFTIRLKEFPSSGEVLTVVFPAFGSEKSKTGFQTSFIIHNKGLWGDVTNLFLDEFKQLSEGRYEKESEFDDGEIEKISKELEKGQE